MNRTPIGIVLSGGGIREVAQIGVNKNSVSISISTIRDVQSPI